MRQPTDQELQAWFLFMKVQQFGSAPYPGIIYSWLDEWKGQPAAH